MKAVSGTAAAADAPLSGTPADLVALSVPQELIEAAAEGFPLADYLLQTRTRRHVREVFRAGRRLVEDGVAHGRSAGDLARELLPRRAVARQDEATLRLLEELRRS
jgi:cytosine/adenosine deaminase-related metal-dependent hydrolase